MFFGHRFLMKQEEVWSTQTNLEKCNKESAGALGLTLQPHGQRVICRERCEPLGRIVIHRPPAAELRCMQVRHR